MPARPNSTSLPWLPPKRQSLSGPPLTTSFGSTTKESVEDAATDKQLFELADRALYTAKQTGRNRVCTTRRS